VLRLPFVRRLCGWLFLAFVGSATPLLAHPAPFSYLDVRLLPQALEITAVVHVLDVAHELNVDEAILIQPETLAPHAPAIQHLIRGRVGLLADGRGLGEGEWSAPEIVPDRHGLRLLARYPLAEPPGIVTVSALMFPYDPIHQTFVNVYEAADLVSQAILSIDRQQFEHYTGTRQGTLAVIRTFVPSGIHHILIGPDHLLFLFGLLLLGGPIRRLILVVSAFTVAHSITLTLAALGIVTPPESIVEPAIALSIVYVGADNLTVRDGRDMRIWIAFAFGLIHGFGFANVLREMDLPTRALGWSLFSFNLGVEIGQVAVVVAVASALAAIRARSEVAGQRLAVAGSVLVIAAGTFWFVERVWWA
jgi:hydrogenase/urease accessory protein HupE